MDRRERAGDVERQPRVGLLEGKPERDAGADDSDAEGGAVFLVDGAFVVAAGGGAGDTASGAEYGVDAGAAAEVEGELAGVLGDAAGVADAEPGAFEAEASGAFAELGGDEEAGLGAVGVDLRGGADEEAHDAGVGILGVEGGLEDGAVEVGGDVGFGRFGEAVVGAGRGREGEGGRGGEEDREGERGRARAHGGTNAGRGRALRLFCRPMSVSVRVGGVSALWPGRRIRFAVRRQAGRERALWAALAAMAVGLSGPAAWAEPPSPKAAAAEVTRAERAQALHDEAAALYERGEYRVAIDKLEEALKLDPSGRELVYNLALIHERLGDIDAAEGYYRRYLEMEKDGRVREKVHATLKRLEGARKELSRGGTPLTVAAPRALEASPPLEPAQEPPQRRRYTGWVIVLTSIAGSGLLASTAFGISAIAHNPGGSARTGGGVSIGDLQANAATAHRDAMVADISFLTGAIAGGVAIYLYAAGRPSRAPDPLAGMPRPSGAIVAF